MCFGFFASLMSKILNLWEDFLKVVEFIENNRNWLDIVLKTNYL